MTSSAKGEGGFQIMTADDGRGGVFFAEDDVIFYNYFRANFWQFYYQIWIKVNQNFKNMKSFIFIKVQ